MTISPPAIILVKPQMGENIGAAARVMKNFGLTGLRVVAPRDGWPNEAAISMSAGAKDIIEAATLYDTTAEALHDVQYILAATARPRDLVKDVVTPRKAGELLAGKAKAAIKPALLFGAERSGLENDDIVLTDAIVSIPINPEYPSLNLAQSIAVLCYEWFAHIDDTPPVQEATAENAMASREEVVGFFEHLEAELDKVNFFRVPDKRPKMVHNLRNIFTRAELTEQEVRTLRGLVRSLVERKHL